jgi:hypothetical protein
MAKLQEHVLEPIAADVRVEDFHAVCAHLGRFAAMQTASPERLPGQTALLHEPHPSGLTLIYVQTEQFVPRRHGTWCVVAPLHRPVEVQNWTEFIPPAESTGDMMAHALPDVHYHCEVGDGLLVPKGQWFNIVADHRVEVLLLFGEHPNHTWPESRYYVAAQHAERILMYPETPVTTC